MFLGVFLEIFLEVNNRQTKKNGEDGKEPRPYSCRNGGFMLQFVQNS